MNKPTGKLLFAYQTIATLEQKLATLEAENAKLRAGQEPVAFRKPSVLKNCNVRYSASTDPQSSAAPDAITMADVMRAWEYAEDHPHKYLRGTTNWCAAVAHSLNQRNPSAPATGIANAQGVNQQLLEALEDLVRVNEQHNLAIQQVTGTPAGWKDDYLNRARAAIAAARKGDGE